MDVNPHNDADILDNLQAADNATPTDAITSEDDPLRHVDGDVIRNIDTLQVDLPQVQEEAQRAELIANEAMALKKRGVIHSLEADRLATLVPAVQASAVSYTSAPTSVGVSHAVELLESEAQTACATAATKALDSIDRAIQRTDAHLSKLEPAWISALASYQTAVENVRSARGATPESDPNAYIGNDSAVQVLRKPVDEPPYDDLIPHLGALAQAIGKHSQHTLWRLEALTQSGVILLGDASYRMDTLMKGSFEANGEHNNAVSVRKPTYVSVLTGPSSLYPDLMVGLQHAMRAMIERLRTAGENLQAGKDSAASIQDVTHAINDATLAASFNEQLALAADMLLSLTQAATAFYEACATTGMVQVAQEKRSAPRAVRKFF